MSDPKDTMHRDRFRAAAERPLTAAELRGLFSKRPRRDGPHDPNAMNSYIGALGLRLGTHFARHVPRWREAEKASILKRWHAHGLVDRSTDATRSAMQQDAWSYADALLRARVAKRLERLQSIGLSYRHQSFIFSDPLDLIFDPRPGRYVAMRLRE